MSHVQAKVVVSVTMGGHYKHVTTNQRARLGVQGVFVSHHSELVIAMDQSWD